MSPNLSRLLIAAGLVFALGFMCYPIFYSVQEPEETAVQTRPEEGLAVTDDTTPVDDWTPEDEEPEQTDETVEPEITTITRPDPDKRRILNRQDDELYTEEDVPEDPTQKKVPEARGHASFTSSLAQVHRLKKRLERESQKPYKSKDLQPVVWDNPEELYQVLAKRVLTKIEKLDEKSILQFMQQPANRLDLARINLIRRTGSEELIRVASLPSGRGMLTMLANDLTWISGVLYSGPSVKLEQALTNMELIYRKHGEDFLHPVLNKIGTIAAMEFAREGWNPEDMMARYEYYSSSYKQELLNSLFDTLQYWEMRWVVGCAQPSQSVGNWGEPRNLKWMRDNVRLPAEQYLGAEGQLCYRLRNVAGDSVFSSAYLAPVLPYVNGTTAWAYREIGGVCGALSHYATYGALASGLPAATMGEPGHCAYAIRINGEWKRGNSIYWQHQLSKTFFNEPEWDYLILTENLYHDFYTTLVADQLVAMADFLGARRKMTASFNCYELAIKVQPLNWPALNRYAGYLKVKAPEDKEKWQRLHDSIVDGLGKQHYNAASKLLVRRVYPNLAPMIKDRNKLNKMYAGLFKNFDGWGTNRWDVIPTLDAQINTYKTNEDKKVYMREVVRVLMGKPEYSGAVLTWGLKYISQGLGKDEAAQDDFTDMLVRMMGQHTRNTRKEQDQTWATLGEAINAATENNDRRVFQAIGKLAYRKCKDKFPKKMKHRVKSFPGRIVSETGIIDTATTLGAGQVASSCLHWAVLQKSGGAMPGKFEGKAGVTVGLEKKSQLTGVICVTSEEKVKDDRPFYIEVSNDGQNWNRVFGNGVIDGAQIRFDMRQEKPTCQYLRLLREGDKYEPGIVGFYVYGKQER
ncbi:MAG: hypothetical protein IJE66_02280 [Akkermansia sp.]|nr:hypothetical protein [Akkermansia sp.]